MSHHSEGKLQGVFWHLWKSLNTFLSLHSVTLKVVPRYNLICQFVGIVWFGCWNLDEKRDDTRPVATASNLQLNPPKVLVIECEMPWEGWGHGYDAGAFRATRDLFTWCLFLGCLGCLYIMFVVLSVQLYLDMYIGDHRDRNPGSCRAAESLSLYVKSL